MNPLDALGAFTSWLLPVTLQAGVLVILILAVQAVMRSRLSPRWRIGLWFVLILRLILPWTPPSSLSVANLWSNRHPAQIQPIQTSSLNAAPVSVEAAQLPADVRNPIDDITDPSNPNPALPSQAGTAMPARPWGIRQWLPVAWLAGVVSFMLVVVAQSLALGSAIRKRRPVTDQSLLDLLEECKETMVVRAWLMTTETPSVKTPALFGFIRPRLLLPEGAMQDLGRERMRHVLMHELAHLKRHDIATNWLVTLLQAIHWFNPLLWYGFHRLRADRELVCDAMVLEAMRADTGQDYGRTIIHMLESVSKTPRIPALAGILENKAALKERLTLIAQFNPRARSLRYTVLAALILTALACVGLTAKKESKPIAEPKESPREQKLQLPAKYNELAATSYFTDPKAIGIWQAVDLVHQNLFDPNKRAFKGEFCLKQLGIYEGGLTSFHWRWSKGFMIDLNGPEKKPYTIKQISGAEYLFVEDNPPNVIVFKKIKNITEPAVIADGKPLFEDADVPATSYLRDRGNGDAMLFDKIDDKVFVDDPRMRGKWRQVDTVLRIDDFKPGRRALPAQFTPIGLAIYTGGHTSGPWVWTRGLMLHVGLSMSDRYEIKTIGARPYLFIENKHGEYMDMLKKPPYIVFEKVGDELPEISSEWMTAPGQVIAHHHKVQLDPTSRVENGKIVDKTDYPFENDAELIGTWKRLDLINDVNQFQPGESKWPRYDVVYDMFFIEPNGKTGWPAVRWTRGYFINDGDKTAEHYQIRQIDKQTYLIQESKGGDYTTQQFKPKYWVFQKVSGATPSMAHEPAATHTRSTEPINEKIDKIRIGYAAREDIVSVFGEPIEYAWGNKSFTLKNLPEMYCMNYPAELQVVISAGRVDEIRISQRDYAFEGMLSAGASVDDVLAILGLPTATVIGKNEWKDGVLYRDIDGQKGAHYYSRLDRGVRMFFWNNRLSGIYLTRKSMLKQAAAPVARDSFSAKIDQIRIGKTTRAEAVQIFGEPAGYAWGNQTYSAANLPPTYMMRYGGNLDLVMRDGTVHEIRIMQPGYKFEGRIQVGSSLEDALAAVGQPTRTIENIQPDKNGPLDRDILYKDMSGRKGYCYYDRPDKGIRIFFSNYTVNSLYLTGNPNPSGFDFTRIRPISSVNGFDDVRWKDMSALDLTTSSAIPATFTFNSKTVWPPASKLPAGCEPRRILDDGMNPGLGVRELHKHGITGKGVSVAIIDQPLLQDHPEFAGKIAAYHDVGCGSDTSMHGPAVTSLLVGNNIGTAPDATLFYVAAPSWTGDTSYQAKALDWIIERNHRLPAGQKIRVVSVSAAPSGPGSPFTKNQSMWDDARKRAEAAGILVLDCTSDHGIVRACYYDPNDRDNAAGCKPFFPGLNAPKRYGTNQILAPASPRTVAEEYVKGEFTYQYTGRGGLSWSIPYAAGVLAMGWQVNPDLTPEAIVDLLFKSSRGRADGTKIIDPAAFVKLVESRTRSAGAR